MKKSDAIFNTEFQQENVKSKIVVGLERISEVFRVLLWEYAKKEGLSPIQIQILVFVAYHKPSYRTVSYLAKEFNVTKPTISDSIKVLESKKMVTRNHSSEDKRSYHVALTSAGKEMVNNVDGYGQPLNKELGVMNSNELDSLYNSITQIIHGMNQQGIIQVQRSCYACTFHQSSDDQHFCTFLNKELTTSAIRLDCPEFEPREE